MHVEQAIESFTADRLQSHVLAAVAIEATIRPEDGAYLVELEPHVTHYEVLIGPETGMA